MKRLTYLFVTCMMSLVVASCGGRANSTEIERIAQLEDSIKALNIKLQSNTSAETQATKEESPYVSSGSTSTSSHSNIQSVAGIYEVKDHLNQVWIFTLNSDESATVSKKGSDICGYGSWDDGNYDGGIWFNFEEVPRIVFPNMEEGFSGHGDMNNGYLYRNVNAAKSKDPNQRLIMTKIK